MDEAELSGSGGEGKLMSSERINSIKINLATCTAQELENIQRNLGNTIMEREWELSLVREELESRRIEVVE